MSSIILKNIRDNINNCISPLIAESASKFCIIDPPNHPNVGDSAIFVGEYDFLNNIKSNSRIVHVDKQFYSDDYKQKILNSDYVFFHGGGNFGDLWKNAHDFRIEILEQFPEKPKIQFPQSIYFDDLEYLDRTKKAISQQKSFIMLVRDTNSLQFAKQHFDCETYLCPDMAFAMDRSFTIESKQDVFMLMRTDKERVFDMRSALDSMLSSKGLSFDAADWIDDDPTFIRQLDLLLCKRGFGKLASVPGYSDLAFYVRLQYALERVNYGVALLGSGRNVVTDRLHAMVLSTIVGIPNFAFSSFDSKVKSLYDTWLSDVDTTHFVTSIDEIEKRLV